MHTCVCVRESGKPGPFFFTLGASPLRASSSSHCVSLFAPLLLHTAYVPLRPSSSSHCVRLLLVPPCSRSTKSSPASRASSSDTPPSERGRRTHLLLSEGGAKGGEPGLFVGPMGFVVRYPTVREQHHHAATLAQHLKHPPGLIHLFVCTSLSLNPPTESLSPNLIHLCVRAHARMCAFVCVRACVRVYCLEIRIWRAV